MSADVGNRPAAVERDAFERHMLTRLTAATAHVPDRGGYSSRYATTAIKLLRSIRFPFVLLATPVILVAVPFDQANAQRLTGRVIDDLSGAGVAFANITLMVADSSVRARTSADANGYFVLDASTGVFRLRVEALGYLPLVSDSIPVNSGEAINLLLRLSARGIPLEPLEVRVRAGDEPGRYGFERRRASGKGVFFTQDSIRLREPVVMSDAFRGIPQISTFGAPAWVGAVEGIWTWSGGKCLKFYIDHFPRPIGRGSFGFDLNLIDVRRVKGIEIYRNILEVPQELRNAMRMGDLWPIDRHLRQAEPCGLVWVWTELGW